MPAIGSLVLWLGRLKARHRIGRSVRLWYHPSYAPRSLAQVGRVPGLPIERSELVMEQLASEGLLRPRDILPAPLATVRELARVHSHVYLEHSGKKETLGSIFGLPPEDVEVDELLGAARFAVGGTVAAARAVAGRGFSVGMNLGGGFHHAQPEQGGGFCVYNDVAIAIAALRAEGVDGPVAIVDLDYHQGDGNLVAFASDPTVLTYSIHGAVWAHVEATADIEILLPSGTRDAEYLAVLARTLPPALEAHEPSVIFFLAGNDVLGGDRLGDFALTGHGVLRRDREVVDWARDHDVPVVITLAGGYSDRAWQCTASLLRWLLADVALVCDERQPDVRTHYARIARQLDPVDLQSEGDKGLELTEEDILGDLGTRGCRRLVLDYYSRHGIELALERYGLFDKIRSLGFDSLRLEVDPSDPSHQSLRVFGRGRDGHEHRLVELVLRRAFLSLPAAELDESVETVFIEWLLLQNPTACFTLERPRFPGQEHPGLGLATEVTELLRRVCHRLGLEAIAHRPAHYHTGVVASRQYRFVDPTVQGRLQALRCALAGVDLHDGSVAVDAGRVRLADGTTVAWQPDDQMMPVSERVRAYFAAPAYLEAVDAAARDLLDRGLHLVGEPAALGLQSAGPEPGQAS